VTDDGDDALVSDELLRDVTRHNPAARVVLEQDVEATLAGPVWAAVDLFERQVDSALVGGAVALAPRSGCAEGYGCYTGARARRDGEDKTESPDGLEHRPPHCREGVAAAPPNKAETIDSTTL
jgi:hypothetical protein